MASFISFPEDGTPQQQTLSYELYQEITKQMFSEFIPDQEMTLWVSTWLHDMKNRGGSSLSFSALMEEHWQSYQRTCIPPSAVQNPNLWASRLVEFYLLYWFVFLGKSRNDGPGLKNYRTEAARAWCTQLSPWIQRASCNEQVLLYAHSLMRILSYGGIQLKNDWLDAQEQQALRAVIGQVYNFQIKLYRSGTGGRMISRSLVELTWQDLLKPTLPLLSDNEHKTTTTGSFTPDQVPVLTPPSLAPPPSTCKAEVVDMDQEDTDDVQVVCVFSRKFQPVDVIELD